MPIYFHLAPILLSAGSIIEPGNFGRILRLVGPSHPLHRREMAYEAVRQGSFTDRPSRLECLFGFLTRGEAALYGSGIQGYASSVLYEIESAESDPHIADANNGVQHFGLPSFDPDVIAYYWGGWQRSPDPTAVILREVLLRQPVIVRARI
ncbi:hypothetical protein MTR72_37835 [Bradyrhizobium sp. ISRA442]|uniref:hypothetical protein n=1 Tax=Bradyrhizobium sp. ISRA442 TaxID=2866197 RepID=UPI00311ABA24